MILLQSFWDMGGYGLYIWPAYGVSLLALLWIGIASYKNLKSLEKRLKDLEKARAKK